MFSSFHQMGWVGLFVFLLVFSFSLIFCFLLIFGVVIYYITYWMHYFVLLIATGFATDIIWSVFSFSSVLFFFMLKFILFQSLLYLFLLLFFPPFFLFLRQEVWAYLTEVFFSLSNLCEVKRWKEIHSQKHGA